MHMLAMRVRPRGSPRTTKPLDGPSRREVCSGAYARLMSSSGSLARLNSCGPSIGEWIYLYSPRRIITIGSSAPSALYSASTVSGQSTRPPNTPITNHGSLVNNVRTSQHPGLGRSLYLCCHGAASAGASCRQSDRPASGTGGPRTTSPAPSGRCRAGIRSRTRASLGMKTTTLEFRTVAVSQATFRHAHRLVGVPL